MIKAGEVLGYIGIGCMSVGAIVVLMGLSMEGCGDREDCDPTLNEKIAFGGLGIGLGGIAIGITGLVLAIVGNQPSARAGAAPLVVVGSQSGALRWSF